MRFRLFIAVLISALISCLTVFGTSPPAQAGVVKVKLSNINNGKIRVNWNQAPGRDVSYAVQIATDRSIETYVSTFPVPRGQTWLDVPHADLVTPDSGAYTFVKVKISREGQNSGTRVVWIKPKPVTPPATASKVKIATFNVRVWGAEDKAGKKDTSWKVRRKKIAASVRAAKPGVLVVQEASGAPKWKVAGKRWQFQDLAKRLPKKYRLTSKGLYTTSRKSSGSQGSRIIYNSKRYEVLRTGYLKTPSFSPSRIRWAPWVLLRDRRTSEEFYAASAHLASGRDKPGSRRLYDMRQRQTDFLHSQLSRLKVTGRGVYLGGDLNSTNNTKPDNNVHRTLVRGGWYDAFASTAVTGASYPTTNGFKFPVKTGAFRRDYIMSLGAPKGSHSFKNHAYTSRSQLHSDHFMQSAVLPVTSGPYLPAISIGRTTYRPLRR